MTTRSVLLDFGNVIAFFDHRKACRQLAELSTAAMTADDIYMAIFNTSLEEAYDTGRMSTPAFLDALRTTLQLQADDDEIARAWCDIFTPNDAMAEAVPALKARGLRLVLASNTNALHYGWFGREFADTLSLLDAQVLSYQVGCRKPDPQFFRACLTAAGCPVAECLYVDDREDLVVAGHKLGLHGLVYTPAVDVLAHTCY